MLRASRRGDYATVESLIHTLLTSSADSEDGRMPDRAMIHVWLRCFEQRGDWAGAERCWAQLHTLQQLTPQAARKRKTPPDLILKLQIERVDAMSYRLMMQTYLIAAGGIGSSALPAAPTAIAHTLCPPPPAPEQLAKIFPLYEQMRTARGLHFSCFDFGCLIDVSVRSGHDAFAVKWAREAQAQGVFNEMSTKVHEQLHEAHRRLLHAPPEPAATESMLPVPVALAQWDALSPSAQNALDCSSPDFFPALYVGLLAERRLGDADRLMCEYMELQQQEGASKWRLESVHAWLKAYASPRGQGQLAGAMRVWSRMHYAGISPLVKTYTLMLRCLSQDSSRVAKMHSHILSGELAPLFPQAESGGELGSAPSASAEPSVSVSTTPHYLQGPPLPSMYLQSFSVADFAHMIRTCAQFGDREGARKWGARAKKWRKWAQLSPEVKLMADPDWTEKGEADAAAAAAASEAKGISAPMTAADRALRFADEWSMPLMQSGTPVLQRDLPHSSPTSIADELMADPVAQARFHASVQVANAYLYTHVRSRDWRGAERLWTSMRQHGPVPDVTSYRTMMQVYARAGVSDLQACLQRSDALYAQMTQRPPQSGEADAGSFASEDPAALPPLPPAAPGSTALLFDARDLDAMIVASWKARLELRRGRNHFFADGSDAPASYSQFDPPPPPLADVVGRHRACALLAQHVLAWGLRATAADMWNEISNEARNAVASARAVQNEQNRVARIKQQQNQSEQHQASSDSKSNATAAATEAEIDENSKSDSHS